MATQKVNDNHAHDKYYERFSLAQRVEHFILILTFTALAVTGLPQKFVGNAFAEGMIAAMGGIETVRIIHRIAAIGIVLQSVYHVLVLGYRIWVRRIEMSMLPGLKDATDAIDVIRYNLGLTKEHPEMPRYNFGEKVEYWAMVWGTVIMAITGFMLWNPIATARFLPGQIIPAAKSAHGAEAILAVLAILIWHFYNVHIKSLNRSIFSGKMPHHQMEEEHGQELEHRVAGRARPAPNPEGVRRRERIYVPIAVVLALLLSVGVFLFATFEETAIATLPEPSTRVPVFSTLEPTPETTGVVQVAASLIPHPVEGQEQCETCHGPNGMRPFPPDHAGRPNASCTVCHLPGPTPEAGAGGAGGASAVPHPVDGQYANCTACHAIGGLRPFPENHTVFPEDSCTGCHQPAAAEGTPEDDDTPGRETPEAEATTEGGAGGASAIPHPIEGETYANCEACHAIGGLRPFPENHTAFPVDSCTGCHQPAAAEGTPEPGETPEAEATSEGGAGGASAIPHPIEGETYANCEACHAIGGLRPFPENHTAFKVDSCTGCHQPAEGAPEAGETPEAEATTEEASGATATPSGPSAMPANHDLTNPVYENCVACHGLGQIRPYPAIHEFFPQDNCTACHKPAE